MTTRDRTGGRWASMAKRMAYRPMLELVEDRLLPTTFPVALELSAVEGQTLNGPVAVFSTNDPPPQSPGNYLVQVAWGDGTVSPGTVAATGPNQFRVTASHVYPEENKASIQTLVTVTDLVDHTMRQARSAVSVTDAPLSATGTNVTAFAGAPFTGVVATLTDANPKAPLSDFSATVNWGDGTTSAGTIAQPGGTGTTFNISGTHTYATVGSFPVTVSIADVGGSTAIATGTASAISALVVTNTNDSGDGSLRAVIAAANSIPGVNLIRFAIPGPGPHIIHVLSPLPPVTDPAAIDAYTQPGATPNTLAQGDNAVIQVVVDGSAAGAGADGLVLEAGNSLVRGLAIDNFRGRGIALLGKGGDQIRGDFIGTDASGNTALGNGQDGVLVFAVGGNTVGGSAPADRNVLSGNRGAGVRLFGASATGNLVAGNLVGTNASGSAALANLIGGVAVEGAPGNLIGGTRNIISGNAGPGILISGPGASNNLVAGNFIGTDASGTRALGNVNIGVLVEGAAGNTIGGTSAVARNIISGNLAVAPVPPPMVPPEATGAGGIVVIGTGASNNLVEGNDLGTDVTGTRALGNGYDGISLSGAPRNTVGGLMPGQGNVIAGNGFVGVRIVGPSATGNVVLGNLIGTDRTGSAALGNGTDGVFLNGAPGNTIGGTSAAARNIISANRGNGIDMFGAGASQNAITGNFVGTNSAGTGALGNRFDGVFLNGAVLNTVGGATAGAGNLIGDNGFSGVQINGRAATGNVAQGNLIAANAAFGVLLSNARGNTVGGTTPGAGNMIVTNAFGGIEILVGGSPVVSPDTAGNVVQGNLLNGNGRGPFHTRAMAERAIRVGALRTPAQANRLHPQRPRFVSRV